MQFFEDQRLAKKKTQFLFRAFLTLVFIISFGTGLSLSYAIQYKQGHIETTQFFLFGNVFIYTSFITLGVIFGVTWFTTWKLKTNPLSICRKLGAKKCIELKDPKHKQYINIVEEMSIASGVPLPEIFVLEDPAINAFACGFDINSAAVCVTTGTIENLTRDELQAVIGHEFSHILNGDMNLNLRLVGMVSGLIFLYQIGYHLSVGNRRRSYRSKKSSGGGQLGLIIMLFGGVGWLAGSWLKSRISVQREFLADASAVQFTRNPQGLLTSFEKIMMSTNKQYLTSPEAKSFSHMYFSDGVKSFFSFRTHPPLLDRIKRIDKNYVPGKTVYSKKTKKKHDSEQSESHNSMTMDLKQGLLIGILANSQSETGFDAKATVKKLLENKLSTTETLNTLQVLSSFIKGLSVEQKSELQKFLKDAVYKDKKINFFEFIVMGYVRPSLIDIPIRFKSLSLDQLRSEIDEFSQFVFKVSNIKEDFSELSLKVLRNKADIKLTYTALFGIFDRLRFAELDLKESIVEDLRTVCHHDGALSEKEILLFNLVYQILGIPSGNSIQKN